MITKMDANRFVTYSLNDARILRILSAALEAVDPYRAVKKHLPALDGKVYGLGIGKASIPMLTALAEAMPLSGGLAISKHASFADPRLFPVIEGGHPIPDARSLLAGERALEFVSSLSEEDTLVCLISGGGSALVTVPLIPLEALQGLTSLLLARGARIDEINTVRRHLDRLKGGGLAYATRARIVSLILSDVIGNPLEAIASGPTAPDPTTRADALAILEKYLGKSSPLPSSDSFRETLKPGDTTFSRVQNIIIADNELAMRAAWEQAKREGFQAEILTHELQGEAREIGKELARRLRSEIAKRPRPLCLIAGGETTVTISGNGKGGRNQELALSAVEELADLQNVMMIALASDGEDGPTDAAGAVVTGETAQRAKALGLRAADHLSRNDAYPFFDALGDLLRTGPTGTNVNDMILLFAF